MIAKVSGESREQVRKYIRLTYLIPELLKIVDDTVIHDKKTYLTLGITTAVELSYLNKLDFNSLEKILDEKKGNQNDKITFNREKQYYQKSY